MSGGGLDLAVAGFFRKRSAPPPEVGLSILEGDGAGNFTVSQVFLGGFTLGTPVVAAGKFNGDEKQDLAVSDGTSRVTIFLQTNGGFVRANELSLPFQLTALAVGDLAGDGELDLAAGIALGVPGQSDQMLIRFGDGTGGFAGGPMFNTGGTRPRAIVTGDFDSDGHLDLAVLHFDSVDVSILLRDASQIENFVLKAPQLISLPTEGQGGPAFDAGTSLVVLDFNDDGKLDLAAARTGNHEDDFRIFILQGDGQGDFSISHEFKPGLPPRSIAAGDFDGDGLPDLAASFFCGDELQVLPDTTPPTVTCSVSPNVLWPPNHRLVAVNAVVTVTDTGSGPASRAFTLLSVTSNEPDEGMGDGDFPNDIQGFNIGTQDTGFLRAERSSPGTGRVYTLTYEGKDVAGNAATCAVTVTVPHDQRK